MTETRDSSRGWPLFVAGLTRTGATGEADWFLAFIGFAGEVRSVTGLYLASRKKRAGGVRHAES